MKEPVNTERSAAPLPSESQTIQAIDAYFKRTEKGRGKAKSKTRWNAAVEIVMMVVAGSATFWMLGKIYAFTPRVLTVGSAGLVSECRDGSATFVDATDCAGIMRRSISAEQLASCMIRNLHPAAAQEIATADASSTRFFAIHPRGKQGRLAGLQPEGPAERGQAVIEAASESLGAHCKMARSQIEDGLHALRDVDSKSKDYSTFARASSEEASTTFMALWSFRERLPSHPAYEDAYERAIQERLKEARPEGRVGDWAVKQAEVNRSPAHSPC